MQTLSRTGAVIAGLLLWIGLPGSGAEFRASVVKVDITPEHAEWLMGYDARQSTGVHDRIYHRIVAMDDGAVQFYIISSDLACFRQVSTTRLPTACKKSLESIREICGGASPIPTRHRKWGRQGCIKLC